MTNETSKKIEPSPGNLVAWIEQETTWFLKLAAEGKLLDATLNDFETELKKNQLDYANSEKYSASVTQDSEHALRLWPFYVEQIKKSQTKHNFWRDNLLQVKSHNLDVIKDLGQQLLKYILVGYGVVFVAIVGAFSGNGTSAEIKFNLSIALLSLCVGFFLAIVGNAIIFFSLSHLIDAQQNKLLNGGIGDQYEKQPLFWSNIGQYSVGFSGIILAATVCVFATLNWLDIQSEAHKVTGESVKYSEIDDR